MGEKRDTDKSIDEFPREPAKSNKPTNRELHLVRKLLMIYEEAWTYRQKQAVNWETYRKFVRGHNQWPARRPKHKVSALVNFLPSNLERKAALLTDTKPKIEIRPRRTGLDDTSKILTKCIDAIWEEQEIGQKLVELAIQAQTFGSTFTNTIYDRDLDGGRGDIDVVVRDPRSVLIDPNVRRSYLLNRGEFVILEDVLPLSVCKDMWPARADLIRPSEQFSTFHPIRQTGLLGSLVSRIWKPSQQNDALKSEIPRCVVREFWMRDRSKNQNGQDKYRNQSRKITMINDVIVADGDNPYYDGNNPLDMLDWHFDLDTAWGWGDVELLKGPQELINKMTSTIVENAIMMSNAIWIGDADALSKKDWDRLTNEPGSHVRKRPGKELRREPGVPLPNYVFEALEYFKSRGIDEISGMVEVMKGLRTGQVESGVAIESLQMMAQAMIRLKARSMESMMKRIGQKLIARVFQYYTDDRILNLVGTDEEFRQFKFVRSELIKPHNKRVPDAFRDYQFMIVPGSSLAMSKMQKVMMATQLFQMGIIDELELLKSMDYPNAERVAAQAKVRRQQMMQAEAQQGGGDSAKGNSRSFPNQMGARGGEGSIM